jgi:hypothetical protein
MSNIITQDAKYQEQVIEYKFLSDLMLSLAKTEKKLELLRVQTDSFGYDVILKVDHIVRFIQLKSRVSCGRAQYWDVHKSLLEQKDGRIVVIFFDITDDGLILNYNYLPLQKYSETINASPKYKKDSARYCKVSYKNLDKNTRCATFSVGGSILLKNLSG